MKKSTASYRQIQATADGGGILTHAGVVLAARTAHVSGLAAALTLELTPWRKPLSTHDPAKILLDVAVALIAGGDCLADIAIVRDRPEVFGLVASDPTVSRLIRSLAEDPVAALAAIARARAAARAHVWKTAAEHAPDHDRSPASPLIIDLDATLVTAHSEKQNATPTYKKGYGFHPLMAFIDHGAGGTGEAAAAILRPGNAGANTAADHIDLTARALAQIPRIGTRPGKSVLIRTDSAGGTHKFVEFLTRRRLSYSVGFGLSDNIATVIDALPADAWTPAYNSDGEAREHADVAELTGVLDLTTWPPGMRVIVRREKPHPGAQLRITDANGWRLTAFATNTTGGQLADLEVRHRLRARCEDRIRIAKDTGLQNLPLKGFAQNQIWLALVELATDLLAWTQILALHGTNARVWEPKKLRNRLFATAAKLVRHARRTQLRYDRHHRFSALLVTALTTLNNYRPPG
ncbi:MAG: IS1380 family transposase [Gordonia sp. (in: high G+C Gram-positive bacteria)]